MHITNFSPVTNQPINYTKKTSNPLTFKGTIDTDTFEYDDPDTCSEKIKMEVSNPYHVRFYGELNKLKYDANFCSSEYNPNSPQIVGTYGDKEFDIKAHYKDKKHHSYSGTFGDKKFKIDYRLGGLFIDDKMKGEINGESFKAKFPSASCKDDNKDLMVLLLHLSGNVPMFEGCNFSVVDSSVTRYGYFNGGLDCNKRPLYTLIDDCWTDPISVPCV